MGSSHLVVWRTGSGCHRQRKEMAPLRGCCGSAAAAAHVLLQVTADGTCQTEVHSARPWSNIVLEGIS